MISSYRPLPLFKSRCTLHLFTRVWQSDLQMCVCVCVAETQRRRRQSMTAVFQAVLLLGAVWVLCLDGAAAQSQACVSNREVEFFVPANLNHNASSPVSIDVCHGKKLNISLEGFSGSPVCHWIREKKTVLTINGTYSMDPKPLSERDSGEYTLECETSDGVMSSKTVQLHVIKRPTKPRLMLENVDVKFKSPDITCISDGNPKPTITWLDIDNKKDILEKKTESTILTSTCHDKGVMCCATNTEGQECSQLFDYDLKSDLMKKDEVSNLTVSPHQSLLLRCRFDESKKLYPVWERDGEKLDAQTLRCSSTVDKEICIKNDVHSFSRMTYLFIKSVNVNHSGIYTCRKDQIKIKSVSIYVQEEGFLSAQLDKSIIIPAQNASSLCLQASVSYHPVLQYCSWEAPNQTMTKCIRDMRVTKHRTVKLCGPFNSGEYKLHLEAGGQTETKTISVCVVDAPLLKLSESENTITCETVSLVPANYTWMSCSSSIDNCENDSYWEEIPGTSQTDSDILCNKTIKSSLSKELIKGLMWRFCLTNSFGSWCKTRYTALLPQASKGTPNNVYSFMVMKIGICILLLALTVVTVVLIYFVKKKKPKYQPQLQIIQMVGPNDNDYIYINFKDFEYDLKWEFPRENLELGKELGSGAFGMVVQATAYGINKPGMSQQVAVKMLKEKHQAMEKEALMSELKMLIHIGHHTNIVNLLGACTESGPVYLIFQYCCYGDLLNYLKSNSEHYHKSVTDAFVKDRFSSIYHNLQLRKSELGDNYVPMYPSATRGQEEIALLNLSSADMDIYEEILENLENQRDDLQTLTFDDLLSFAFQVAKGMDFLSSKNCIHRDLAARNVLVTNGRLVKIGDFGLARDIDNDSNYVVRGNVRLPVKWMAPESIFQGMYTMQSDVWAYGILLWEIFSLGVTPYPGVKVDHTFYSMIERGFKMECPYYASNSVYDIMCECWDLDPNHRPSFSKLVSFMCNQLTDREEKLYHNMLDQTLSDQQSAPAILDISALTKQENKTQLGNDYCQTNSTEESKAMCQHSSSEEKLLKLSDGE
ncbi:receptor-type tyrosine-protein kinase FLT3 [Anabas testudineus]|uniref:receptor-type tyrosine-protein kinase FLT3 n=1 Tax=Anabas testudineus TaxID=64144 RepID=UPI000E45B029|nr:receptor-type tyrosine-protein kinase FLT3 [Anabas testudineus]